MTKAVAEFIKENKPKGQVVYDELTNHLATPLFFRCRRNGQADPKTGRLRDQCSR